MQRELLPNSTAVFIDTAIRFGRDALLLADFCALRRGRLLDLGTGCGILPLALLDAGFVGDIVALDVNADACALAAEGAKACGHSDFLVQQCDWRDYKADHLFDVVICNPPYFAQRSGPRPQDETRALARQESAAMLEDLAKTVARSLKQGGALYLCYRPERLAELIATLQSNRLVAKRLQLVKHRPEDEPWLVLLQARLDGGSGLQILPDRIDS